MLSPPTGKEVNIYYYLLTKLKCEVYTIKSLIFACFNISILIEDHWLFWEWERVGNVNLSHKGHIVSDYQFRIPCHNDENSNYLLSSHQHNAYKLKSLHFAKVTKIYVHYTIKKYNSMTIQCCQPGIIAINTR